MTDKINPLQMLDILDRLRIYAARPGSASDLANDAIAEIERLNKAIRWEQSRSIRVGTHSPGCWGWGHHHYDCALHEINRLNNEVSNLQAGVQMSTVIQPSPEKMLMAQEAARFMNMSRAGFYRNVKDGHLPQAYYITPGTPRWRLSELQAAKEGRWK